MKRRSFHVRSVAAASLLLLALFAGAAPFAFAQNKPDRSEQLRSQFESESDPVRKAKALTRYGDAEFERLHQLVEAENYDEGLRLLEEYLRQVKTVYDALKATGRDAEKKPSGFKELQIHLRKNIRKLNQTILSVPMNGRGPFEAIRRELEGIDRELIDKLFPRQPGRRPEGKTNSQG